MCFSSQQLTQTFVIVLNLGGNVLLVPKCTEAGMPFHSLESAEQCSLASPHCTQSERLGRKIVGSAAVCSIPWEEVPSSFHACSHFKTETSHLVCRRYQIAKCRPQCRKLKREGEECPPFISWYLELEELASVISCILFWLDYSLCL